MKTTRGEDETKQHGDGKKRERDDGGDVYQ